MSIEPTEVRWESPERDSLWRLVSFPVEGGYEVEIQARDGSGDGWTEIDRYSAADKPEFI